MRKYFSLAALFFVLLNVPLAMASMRSESEKMFANTQDFTDVPVSHPNHVAVAALKSEDVIKGYDDGTFKPDNPVNRAELVKMVVEFNVIGSDIDAGKYSNCFPDVKTDWYAKYVCYALEKGWVKGYPDGNFKPSNPVNRAEAIKIVINALLPENLIVSPSQEQMALPMPADSDMSAWYAGYLRFSIVEELLDGQHVTQDASGKFYYQPGGNMTRKEVAEMMYRVILYMTERTQFPMMMAAGTCYWLHFHDSKTEQELHDGIVGVFNDAGYTEDEMNALTAKFNSDPQVTTDMNNHMSELCPESLGGTQQEIPIGDPEGAASQQMETTPGGTQEALTAAY